MVEDGTLGLQPIALKVLLCLYWIVKRRKMVEPMAIVKVKQSTLLERTGGSSRTTIEKAIRELEAKHFIRVVRDNRKTNQQLASNDYVLLNPQTGADLERKPGESLLWGANGLRYFNVPESFVADGDASYSMAQISSSAMAVYTAALYASRQRRSLEFSVGRLDLRKLSGLIDNRTFGKALSELRDVGLLWFEVKDKTLAIQLQDPQTGSPAYTPNGDDEDDPASYRVLDGGGGGRRPVASKGTPEQYAKLIRSLFQEHGGAVVKPDGQMTVLCCFHSEETPSLSIGTKPRFRFNCFGCNKHGGDISEIVMAVHGCQRAEAMCIIAEAFGYESQFVPTLRPKEGETRYVYYDERGKPLKMVRRFGSKQFEQWKPVHGGWMPGVQGVGPCLYSPNPLVTADTVAVVEGEKDADTVTKLGLVSSKGGQVLGVTSGGSDTWHPTLATQLKGKRVIVMPDADAAGEKYARDVIASLKAAGIEYVLVSFAGTGQKDVTDFLESHGKQALVHHVRQTTDWIVDLRADEDEIIEI